MKKSRTGFRPVWLIMTVATVLCTGIVGQMVLAAEPPEAAVIACNERVSSALLAGGYDSAEQSVESFMAAHPDHPAGPLFLASVRQYRAIDYEQFPSSEAFEPLIDTAVRLSDARTAENEHDLWARYYRAAAHGLLGSYASLTGSVLSGIMKGRSGAGAMSDILETDPSFADAYLLLGSYHYWKSDATRHIDWLPFIGDQREQGIREVRQAIAEGHLTGTLAYTALLEILLDHEPEQARMLADSLVCEYPKCRLFRWQLGEAYKKLRRFGDAERVFSRIAASFEHDPADDGSGPLRCWWKLAVLAHDTGRYEDCVVYSRKVIDAGTAPTVARRQERRIGGAKRYIEEYGHE